MSFGNGGGFSFGGNNNNQTSGFGGFGNSPNTNTGFGATTNTGFGSSTAASNPFGGSTFGSSTGGFGSNTNAAGSSLFGNKPASNPFGSSTTNAGGGLFGGSTNNTTGFGTTGGGFGSGNNAFGSNNTSNSSFSFGNANKPAFGSSSSSAPLFGQGGTGTTGGFGSSNAFGAAGSGTALSNQPVPPSEGTASTPFAPTLEKEATGNSSSNYQSINFMQPYQKYSFEELRLADYNAGRRYGNSTGQAGGFGSNTFGGFGANNPGFGANSNTNANPFSSTTTSSSGFGTNTSTTGFGGGGLFGSKPAGGSLFGQQSSAAPSGGIFGATTNNTANSFGAANTGTAGFGSGGGLFGNNQNQNKSSPFGGSSSNTGTGFSFGNTNTSTANTGGGLFGNNNNNNTSNAFGQTQQSGGLFGNANNQQQQQQKPLFGNTGGGFGTSTTQNQSSGGLFGATSNTSGGLFGNNNNANLNTGGGLFNNNNNTTGTSLFGNNNANNAAKPGGLFGSNTFGNNNAGNTNTSLFGAAGTNNQQSGGLFGSNNNNTTSGFSFGNASNKPASTSLFNNPGNNQAGGLGGSTGNFGSVFGTPQNNQQVNQQQPEFRHSSLNDPNPYGQTSIWTGLPMPTPDNSKPIFTPLAATQKMKESQAKPPPSLRLNQSRYNTPPRRPGFGFSYSTYGTPNSAASTPGGSGLSNSLYGSRTFNGGSFGRSFGKSASASNLRSQFNGESEGVLSPTAFVTSNSRWSSGNMRRLTIDRSIRNDLFSRPSLPALPTNALDKPVNGNKEVVAVNGEPPSTEPANKLKKRVSFDKDTTGGLNGTLNGESGALVRTETENEAVDAATNGRTSNGTVTPEVEPVRGNELAVVPEDRESDSVVSSKAPVQAKPDPQPGDYWMKPTRAELSKLPREKLARFVGFQVGRKGCGKVEFTAPVDLTSIPLDDLYEKIVEIRLRSVTVYPDPSTKPPVGKGLNVPSMISIENSWPRARGQPSSATSGPIFDKHVNRLKKMHGTEFVNYEVMTGVWSFRVPHYTRYGLDYDEEDDDLNQSRISAAPDSLGGSQSREASIMEIDSEDPDDYGDAGDDTFAFKQKSLPGGYGRRSVIDYPAQAIEEDTPGFESADPSDSDEDLDNEVSMAGSYPLPTLDSPNKPILKPSGMGTPGKALINIEGDWAEQLQRTISPRKQNRDALRDVQSKVLLDRAYEPMRPRSQLNNKTEFRTSIDIMNSLFSRHEERMAGLKGRKKGQAEPGFEFPYAKRAKTFDDQIGGTETTSGMTESDKLWHGSFKPNFTRTDKLVYKSASASEQGTEGGWTTQILIPSENSSRDVVVSSLRGPKSDNVTMDVKAVLTNAEVTLEDGIPFIHHAGAPFSETKGQLIQQQQDHVSSWEVDIYELSHVLFDEYDDEFTAGLNRQQQQEFKSRIRKDRLSKYLSTITWRKHGERIRAAEKLDAATAAVMHLTAHNVKAACDALMGEKSFHLSLLVAQIDQSDEPFQDDITGQIDAWRSQGVISEMTEEIRALYEILAGSTSIVQGKQNVPVEDRASTFAISEKFELDWIQAFGLCLWYGRHKNGDIHDAVADFQEKLTTGVESASPVLGENGNEDPMWVMLKLFASNVNKSTKANRGNGAVTKVETPVLPQALSALSLPWESQKTFRLHHALVAAVPGLEVDQAKADDLAMSLAFEDSARGNLVGAVYALLHLENVATRTYQIQELLNKNAALLPSPSSDGAQQQSPLWTALVTAFKIPDSWLCEAKALYARSCNAPLAELNYLIQAGDFSAAHECLLRRLAPRLVIDEDWATLRAVLARFGDKPEDKVDSAVAITETGTCTEWKAGGGVYADFVALMILVDGGRRDADTKRQTHALLERLQAALSGLNARFQAAASGGSLDMLDKDREKLEERVALCELGKAVARVWELQDEHGVGEKKSILNLPLTADARLAHARALGAEYYRGVMATAH